LQIQFHTSSAHEIHSNLFLQFVQCSVMGFDNYVVFFWFAFKLLSTHEGRGLYYWVNLSCKIILQRVVQTNKTNNEHKIDLFTSAPLVSSSALATGSSNFHWRQMLILLQLLVSRNIVPKLHLPSFCFFFFFAATPDQAPTRLLSEQCSSMINSLTHCVCALPRWVKEIFFLTFFLGYEQQEYHKR